MATETSNPVQEHGDPAANDFYSSVLDELERAHIRFLVGGAFALYRYTGIARFTKDFDIFVLRSDRDRILDLLASHGYHTEVTFSHWLAKVLGDDAFVDLIYSSGNGVAEVDDGWFEHSVTDEVLGHRVGLIPPEEMIWSKAFVQERERFDGADVIHLVHAIGEKLDWKRLIARFDKNWRVLFSHLVLFGFVYPGERMKVPGRVMDELLARLEAEVWAPNTDERVCRGTILSREQYLADVERRGYRDPRLRPEGRMSPEETARWTAAIKDRDKD